MATITEKGEAVSIGVVDGLDGGLTGQAVEAVRTWQFKPAIGKDGKPIAARVPISPAALRALRSRPVTPPLVLDEDRALLAELDNRWQLPEDGSSLERQIRFKSFSRAMAFVNCLARLWPRERRGGSESVP